MRLEQLRNANTEELNSELISSEKARLAVTAVFVISFAALVGMVATIPDSAESVTDKVRLFGIAASAYATYLLAFAWVGAKDRSSEIIQEARQRSLPVHGMLVREVQTQQVA